jgi:hypothetical protein
MSGWLNVLIVFGVIAFPGVLTCGLYLLLSGWARRFLLSAVMLLPILLFALTLIPVPPHPGDIEGKGTLYLVFRVTAAIVLVSMLMGVGIGWTRRRHG